ncbi:MAG: LysR family transcriptional regulator [Pseudomonadota bacterium]
MNFNDIQAFIAVAEQKSFSAAAEHLHLTQPAVTKRVQNLESSYNTALFDRIGKRISLTHAGEVLLPNARALLSMVQDTQREIHNLSNQVQGSLRIATSHHIGLHRLAPVLRAFTAAYPEVALNITFEDSEVAHGLVRSGDTELAIVTLAPTGEADLVSRQIWNDPLIFVANQPIPGRIGLPELAKLPCVLPGLSTYTGRIVDQRFREMDLSLSPAMSTNYLETIGMLVSVGLGWSVLPATMQEDLSALEVETPPMARQLGCVTNPHRVLSRPATKFLETLSAFAD